MLKNPFQKNSLVNKYQKLISQINSLETNLKTLTDDELRVKSLNLQKQYAANNYYCMRLSCCTSMVINTCY